jgi:hypothetical protein
MLVKSASGAGLSTRVPAGRVSAVMVDTPVFAVETVPPPVETVPGILEPPLDVALNLGGGVR